MKRYVIGFAFDQYHRVALIKKNRPEYQANKWNGIGGKIEFGEDALTAMVREFEEETGLTTQPEDWRQVGHMTRTDNFICFIFTARLSNLVSVKTVTDEVIQLFNFHHYVQHLGGAIPCLANVRSLIELCRMGPSTSGVYPYVVLKYP